MIARAQGVEAAKDAPSYIAPVGEKDEYLQRAIGNITPYLHQALTTA